MHYQHLSVGCPARFAALAVALAFALAAPVHAQPADPLSNPAWKAYWYAGEAELSRYRLEQARYGEVREGNAVLVFVTEDFLPETQVKFEGRPAPDKPVSVLKLNATRNFLTGIYPYSTMTSVFSPVDARAPHAYKVTTSVQEWCGHVFMQLNRRAEGYAGRYFSYFQGEGDREFDLPDALLEDEVWTKIRLNPADLPVGNLAAVPGTLFLRLMHRDVSAYEAEASLTDTRDENLSPHPLKTYRIDYANLNRSIAFTFEADFPHAILAWEETTSPLGGRPGIETTRAVRTHSIKLDYWNRNGLDDTIYRSRLGLE
jgi:hypothetical protein